MSEPLAASAPPSGAPAGRRTRRATDVLRTAAQVARERVESMRPIPEPSPPGPHTRLCIGMATYDDFDGVWFTIASVLLHHPEIVDQMSFVVIDNHPEGPAAAALKALEDTVPRFRYVPFRGFRSTGIRDLIFRETDADIVCCLDSHVLVRPGGLAAIVAHVDEHPDTIDLIQGPLLADDCLHLRATHMEPRWGGGMFGTWGLDERGEDPAAPPFEIGMHGLGLFACRRVAWPGLNPRLRGHGGEEGYLHERFRRAGGAVLCLPAAAWSHRFSRPAGVPFSITMEDRLRNYLILWTELGWDLDAAVAGTLADTAEARGRAPWLDDFVATVRRQAASPYLAFDSLMCVNADADHQRWATFHQQLAEHGLAWWVERRVPAPSAPESERSPTPGPTPPDLAGAIREARRRRYRSVVLVHDRLAFAPGADAAMADLATELRAGPWEVAGLGAGAVAVHARGYASALDALENLDGDGFPRWLAGTSRPARPIFELVA